MDFEIFNSDNFKNNFNGNIKQNESMRKHTTIRIGGEAKIYLEPKNEDSFVFAIKFCVQNKIPYFVLGGGSNIVVDDEFNFVVISTRFFQGIEFKDSEKKLFGLYQKALEIQKNDYKEIQLNPKIIFSAGENWGKICNFCIKHGLLGFESFSGLPGTVGGAIFMNATCFGFSTCDNLISVKYLDLEDLEVKVYKRTQENKDDFGYKKSPFQEKKVILSAEFIVFRDSKNDETEMRELYQKAFKERGLKGHFSAPSAGSVFKNQPEKNIIAGKIIDECGLKTIQIGNAKISDFHANFIVNNGKASSKDVKNLVKFIQDDVFDKKGIELECEIIFIDDEKVSNSII